MARRASKRSTKTSKKTTENAGGEVILLSGGNPQIAKADGDAPVQAYISAMPSWKSDVGHRLDEIIVRTVPNVRKAVRWNSPWYGVEGELDDEQMTMWIRQSAVLPGWRGFDKL